MNALSHDFLRIIAHDIDVPQFEFSDTGLIGDLLLSVSQDSRYDDRTGETFVTAIHSVEVVGLHIRNNVCLTRDQLLQMSSNSEMQVIETQERESLSAAI